MKSRVAIFQLNVMNAADAGNLAATGGGVWAAFGTRGTMTRQGAFASWTDDATVRYHLVAIGRATSLSVGSFPYWSARLYDVTNAQVVIGPTDYGIYNGNQTNGEVRDPFFQSISKTQMGPLTTLPANTAGLRFQYTGGGNGACLYAAYLYVERLT